MASAQDLVFFLCRPFPVVPVCRLGRPVPLRLEGTVAQGKTQLAKYHLFSITEGEMQGQSLRCKHAVFFEFIEQCEQQEGKVVLKCLEHAPSRKHNRSNFTNDAHTFRMPAGTSESIAAPTLCLGDESSVRPGEVASRKSRNPKQAAGLECSSRRVGTSRHNRQRTVTIADEAVLCHAVDWLGWLDISRCAASRKLSEFMQHLQHSLASRFREIWPNPAPEEAKNIVVRVKKEEKARATKGAAMVLVTSWTTRQDTRKLQLCSAQLGGAPATPHPLDPA